MKVLLGIFLSTFPFPIGIFLFEAWGNLRGLTFKTEFFEDCETVEALMADLPALEDASLSAFPAMQKSWLGH